jgi:hypothetical protein
MDLTGRGRKMAEQMGQMSQKERLPFSVFRFSVKEFIRGEIK